MSLPTGTSSVTSASGIPRRRRRSPSLSVPSGKIGRFPPKPSSGAENEGRCGIALVPFPEEAAFHNRDQEFEDSPGLLADEALGARHLSRAAPQARRHLPQ